MKHKTQRTNNVSLKLSDDEKKRVNLLAQERDLSVAEYLRMSALGHRIKPTVIEFKESETVSPDPNHLKIIALLKEILPFIEGNGYLNYKDGGTQLVEIKNILSKQSYTYNDITPEDLTDN